MGVGDIKDHVFDKLSPGNTQADKLSCCSKIGTTVFFVIAFLVGAFSSHKLSEELLITSLIVNGTSPDSASAVPYPQMTFCPFEESGVITDIKCFESIAGSKSKKGASTHKPLLSKKLNAGQYPQHKQWACESFNYDGKAIQSPDTTVWCQMNSTNHGAPFGNGMVYDWPGRVRVYLDTPGTTNFLHCEDCIDGIDGAVLASNTSNFVYWQAHQIDNTGIHNLATGNVDKLTEYRAVHTALLRPEVFDAADPNDIVVALGFYSNDVWQYRSPSDIGAGSARFGELLAFVGGLSFLGYVVHSFISTTLILLLVGKGGLEGRSGYETAPIL